LKYALLGYAPADALEDATFDVELADAETATTVRVRDGRVTFADGPYEGGSEALGGIWMIDVPDLDSALELARRNPAARLGAVEVRPVRER
jgi:hypothetical protein